MKANTDNRMLSRAQGCLLGQLAGDTLGSLVEFQSPAAIRRDHPGGVRDLADGGTWDTIAGQPTDDSEMALALARALVRDGTYDADAARQAYQEWLDSGPFDCGSTVAAGLRGQPIGHSQANGALMRISPLGILGAGHEPPEVAQWAMQDAELTHPHRICREANALYAMAVARAVRKGVESSDLFLQVRAWAEEMDVEEALAAVIVSAEVAPPADYLHQQGWVLIAFHNALWQLLHAPSLEAAVVDTVMRGGDTDTNAAICGALLGAVHGRGAVPIRWVDCLLKCRPLMGALGVHRPRPDVYWPVDALGLASSLLEKGVGGHGNPQGNPAAQV